MSAAKDTLSKAIAYYKFLGSLRVAMTEKRKILNISQQDLAKKSDLTIFEIKHIDDFFDGKTTEAPTVDRLFEYAFAVEQMSKERPKKKETKKKKETAAKPQ